MELQTGFLRHLHVLGEVEDMRRLETYGSRGLGMELDVQNRAVLVQVPRTSLLAWDPCYLHVRVAMQTQPQLPKSWRSCVRPVYRGSSE